jgi:predicted enzyme related to lactoylglutathione lyase
MKTNTVSHFEIYGKNPEALAKLYTQLFDWDVQHMPETDYRLVKAVDTGADNCPTTAGAINGGIATRPRSYGANAAVTYIMVDAIETYIDKAQTLGAKLTKGKTAVPGMGWLVPAVFVASRNAPPISRSAEVRVPRRLDLAQPPCLD